MHITKDVRIRKCVGLDVHKETVACGVCDTAGGPVRYLGVTPHRLEDVEGVLKSLGGAPDELAVVYEAGPTGYDLCRLLRQRGYHCMVAAPSLIPVRAGDRVKTDRRDACHLASLLRAGELRGVTIPGPGQEALRDLSRAREDAVRARLKIRQQLGAMLLRYGKRFTGGKKAWTKKHRRWLADVSWKHAAQRAAFEDYVRALDEADARVGRLTAALDECARTCDEASLISAYQALRGVSLITAVALVAELGDVTRFDNARQLMAFVGVTPSEYSSGLRQRRGAITKTGNRHIRRLLTESAWNYRFPARVSGEMLERQAGLPEAIRAIGYQAQARLCMRYRSLSARKNGCVVTVAIARELLGFVWSIAREVKRSTAAS